MNIRYPISCLVLLLLPGLAFQGCLKPESSETVVPTLIGDLKNPKPEVRKLAADRLGALDIKDVQKENVLAALRNRLNDDDMYVRWGAGDALLKIDARGNMELVLSSLLKEIEDPKAEIRVFAALRLASYESQSMPKHPTESDFNIKPNNDIVATLMRHINDEEIVVRYAAAIALGRIDAPRFKKTILPFILELLNSRVEHKEHYQGDAIDICWEYGPAMKEAVPALVKLMNESKDKYIPKLCKDALERIGTPDALLAIQPLEQAQEALRLKITAISYAIIACFVLIFVWSVKLRKKGRKVFHWFIPITIALIAVMTYSSQTGTVDMDFVRAEFAFWLISSSIGFIPWFISWFILRRRGSLEAGIPAGGGSLDADIWLRFGAFMLDACCVGMAGLVFLAYIFMKALYT